jgi:hypothetical protein
MRRGLFAAAGAVAAQAREAADWQPLTAYDVLPEDCRDGIGNKDVGDVAGDAYFMIKDVCVLGLAGALSLLLGVWRCDGPPSPKSRPRQC